MTRRDQVWRAAAAWLTFSAARFPGDQTREHGAPVCLLPSRNRFDGLAWLRRVDCATWKLHAAHDASSSVSPRHRTAGGGGQGGGGSGGSLCDRWAPHCALSAANPREAVHRRWAGFTWCRSICRQRLRAHQTRGAPAPPLRHVRPQAGATFPSSAGAPPRRTAWTPRDRVSLPPPPARASLSLARALSISLFADTFAGRRSDGATKPPR